MYSYRPISTRHYLFGLGVCLTATIAGVGFDVWQAPRYPKPATIAEAEQIVEVALKAPFPSTRFDVHDATVSACKIVWFRHDNDACNAPDDLQTFTRSYNLRMVRLELDFPAADSLGQSFRQYVFIQPRRLFEERIRKIEARDDALISQARAEVGWGSQAGALKSDWLRAEYSESDLPL